MTAHRDLKRIIRDRRMKTGESYTAARAHVMRERAGLLGLGEPEAPMQAEPVRADAAILKVNRRSARVRILGEDVEITFRTGDVWGAVPVVPGHLVTLVIERRWSWRGDTYASGRIENPRIEVSKLGLDPLPLEGGELTDIASRSDPYEPPDPYAPLWARFTAKPRPSFEFDGIAWGAIPGLDEDEDPASIAAELNEAGDREGAREVLMEALGTDVRFIDAHAHLGNMEFDRSPERALVHYEIGIRIGELSLPPRFDGLLVWAKIYNRPFLRCLNGYALCLWRLGKLAESQRVFERILSLDPSDNQGVRFCWNDLREGRTWDEMQAREGTARAQWRETLH